MLFAALAVALAGCGFFHWSKPGADPAAFDRESNECHQQSSDAGGWDDCMKGRGWSYSGW